MTTAESKVAMKILDQLTLAQPGMGIGRVQAMLGATNVVYSKNTVSFSFKGTRKFSGIHIALNGKDTYDVTLIKKAWNPKTNIVVSDVYAEDLSTVFEKKVGLWTHM